MRIVPGITLTLLLLSMLTLAFNIHQIRASETIYISSDYTFTSNIYEKIVVTADNIVIDGNGYTLQRTEVGIGIDLTGRTNVTIKNMEIKTCDYGIFLDGSSNNTVSGNTITKNSFGIWFEDSSTYNNISGNDMTNNSYGVYLYDSSSNTISENNITNNDHGIYLLNSSNNTIYHNNFVDNSEQVYSGSSTNTWDNGYPSGGNYWSDYSGEDANWDGIGDTPYIIDENNQDNYPLMNPRAPSVESRIWTVDDDAPADFHTIQEVMNAASPRDMIFVHSGTYYENVVVNKTVSLIGENRDTTIVDGNGTGSTIYITADYVTISGLRIRNSEFKYLYAGVRVDGGNYSNITGNTLIDNVDGIFLTNSSNNTVCNNLLVNNDWNGIHLKYSCNYNRISGNNISNGRNGIQLEFDCDYNEISKNKMVNLENICMDLTHLKGNIVTENNMTSSYLGIYLYTESPISNVFYNNSFINNTYSVTCYADDAVWDNGYPSGGNYWSDYTGSDFYGGPYQNETGSDGIGDTPYVIDENNRDHYPLMSPWGVPAAVAEEEKEEAIPLWMPWWFWAIVIGGIGVLAEILYFLKKRKPPTYTPPLSAEGPV